MPSTLRELVEAEVRDDERLLWCAQPKVFRYALRSVPLFLFGVFWTAIVVGWTCAAPSLIKLVAIPFFLVGFGLLSAPFRRALKAHRTAYVLVTRRAVIIEGGGGPTVHSLGPEKLTDIMRREKSDGSGDIIFEKTEAPGTRMPWQMTEVGFFCVDDVREVEKALRAVAEKEGST